MQRSGDNVVRVRFFAQLPLDSRVLLVGAQVIGFEGGLAAHPVHERLCLGQYTLLLKPSVAGAEDSATAMLDYQKDCAVLPGNELSAEQVGAGNFYR